MARYISRCINTSLVRGRSPASCLPSPCTTAIISGVIKPFETFVGVHRYRSESRRQLILPSFAATKFFSYIRLPISHICRLRAFSSATLGSAGPLGDLNIVHAAFIDRLVEKLLFILGKVVGCLFLQHRQSVD